MDATCFLEGVIPPNALRQMKQPILMLHGVEDRFVAKESSLSLLQHLPNAQLHLIKGCRTIGFKLKNVKSFKSINYSFLKEN